MKTLNPRSAKIKKGGQTMRSYLKRVRSNKAFTLVEILIVCAVIGVLAGVVIPRFSGVLEHSEAQASSHESALVQTAMDTMMAKENLSSVTIVSTATNDMSGFPDGTNPLYPNYFRTATTTGTYTCTANGLVTQASGGY